MVRPRKRRAGTNSREVLSSSHGARELLEPLKMKKRKNKRRKMQIQVLGPSQG